MATKIITKNSSTASAVPLAADLVQGELAVNVTDKKLYTKNNAGTVVKIGDTPSIVDNGAATAVTIDTSQNVGIGTSSPTAKLHVSGSSTGTIDSLVVNTQSSTTAAVTATSSTYSFAGVGANTAWFSSNGALAVGNYSAYPIQFVTNGAERARIDSSGNLLVGVTSASNSSNTFYRASGVIQTNYSGSTAGQLQIVFANPNGNVGSIATAGTTTAYNTSSDYRLKDNIQPMSGALAKVAALKPCIYKWKVDGSDGEGFIAHELQEIVPGCVTGEKDAVDADGNPVYQGIDTSFLAGLYAAAIQELIAKNDALEARLAALEAK